jgi:hypothetical protein
MEEDTVEATVEDMADQDMAEGLEDREGAAEHDALERMKTMRGCQDGQHSYDILARALREDSASRVSTSSASASLRLS